MKLELCVLYKGRIICEGCLTLASFDTEFSRKKGRKIKPATDCFMRQIKWTDSNCRVWCVFNFFQLWILHMLIDNLLVVGVIIILTYGCKWLTAVLQLGPFYYLLFEVKRTPGILLLQTCLKDFTTVAGAHWEPTSIHSTNFCVWHGNFQPYKFLLENVCEEVTEL